MESSVPAGNSSVTPTSAEILAAIPGTIPVQPPSTGYLLALTLVAFLMVLLPLVYLTLIVAVGYGVYWHFTHNLWILEQKVRGKGYLLVLLSYLAPGVVGAALFIVLLKPLLARRRHYERPRPLRRDEEPLLFDYVDRLCTALGSPQPYEICLDQQVNASASFVSTASLLTNRLRLIIGMPLIAGLPLRDFTGILAHEFGHFSQFWAMRLYMIIGAINHWLTRVVKERDEWDAWLENTARSLDVRVGWVLYLAQASIWIVRRVLWLLRCLAVLFSRRLSRQMEFNADACEYALVGSQSFSQTTRDLGLLSVASSIAEGEFEHYARESKLVDNFPRFAAAQVDLMTPVQRQRALEAVEKQTTSWDDTHPAPSERIAAAQRAAEPGRFGLEAPATVVFADFDARCREMARSHYSRVLEREVTPQELTPVETLLDSLRQTAEGIAAANRFAGGAGSALNAVELESYELPTELDAEALRAELESARADQLQHRQAYQELESANRDTETEISQTLTLVFALSLRKLPPELQPASAQTRLKTIDAARAHLNQAVERREDLRSRRRPYLSAWSRRLKAALQLLSRPELAARLPDADPLRVERDRIWPALAALSQAMPALDDASRRAGTLRYILIQVMEGTRLEGMQEIIEAARGQLYESMGQAWSILAEVPYPDPIDPAPEHLAAFCLGGLADPENPVEVLNGAIQLRNAALLVWRRVLGRAVQIAVRVEEACGLAPLAELIPAGQDEAVAVEPAT